MAAARATDCDLTLEAEKSYAYGETVAVHVSGLPGFGGVDIFTHRGRWTEEAHYFLMEGTTEFDHVYGMWGPPEQEPLPPLEPGHYVVHATSTDGCEVRTTFHVWRP